MIYVMSDVHGNFEIFESVMEQIELKPEDRLSILGDVTHSIWECISGKTQSDIMIDVDRHLPEKNILGE